MLTLSKDTRDLIGLPPSVRLEALDPQTFLILGSKSQPFREAAWGPVIIPELKRYLALALHGHFMTFPHFGNDLPAAPERGQFVLWEQQDGTFGVLLPLLHEDFRSEVRGGDGGLEILCDCGVAGRASSEVVLALVHLGDDPFDVVHNGLKRAVRWMERGRLREEKITPRWMDFLGWCTWDAFYTEVDESKVLEGLRAFQNGGVVPGQIIIDEGWQDCSPKKYLMSLGLKVGAFTDGRLTSLIARAKSEFGVSMVGCWRTLFGQLRGVDVDSRGLEAYGRRLVQEPGTEKDTFGVVEPEDVARFHEDYAWKLAMDGVDFIKVDFQSALHLMTYEQLGRAGAARLWQHSLQNSVERHFHGEMLNCMSLGSDEVYHTRSSNVARSSDDYFPTRDDSHPAHIRQNLYNALWLSPVQWPDWDMFQSAHPWAWYHAVGRAISGGPVYVSDKPGESDFALLKRFVAADGKLLRCPQPALPARDLLFEDPALNRHFLKAQNRCGDIGLLAVFHPDPDPDSAPIEEEVSVASVEGMREEPCAVYSLRDGFLGVKTSVPVRLACREADLLVLSPVRNGFAPIGLVEKMNPVASIQSLECAQGQATILARGGGRFAVFSEVTVGSVRLDGESVSFQTDGSLVSIETGECNACRIDLHW